MVRDMQVAFIRGSRSSLIFSLFGFFKGIGVSLRYCIALTACVPLLAVHVPCFAQTSITEVSVRTNKVGNQIATIRLLAKSPQRLRRGKKTSRRKRVEIQLRQQIGGADFIDSYIRRIRLRRRNNSITLRRQPIYGEGAKLQARVLFGRSQQSPQWSSPVSIATLPLSPELPEAPRDELLQYADPALAPGNELCPEEDIQAAIFWTNEMRLAQGLSPLDSHNEVRRAAIRKADQMASSGVFEHDGWLSFMLEEFSIGRFGNNIAHAYTDAAELIDAFSRSPNHLSNMISPRYQFIGIGCVIDSTGHRWWSQNFYGL